MSSDIIEKASEVERVLTNKDNRQITTIILGVVGGLLMFGSPLLHKISGKIKLLSTVLYYIGLLSIILTFGVLFSEHIVLKTDKDDKLKVSENSFIVRNLVYPIVLIFAILISPGLQIPRNSIKEEGHGYFDYMISILSVISSNISSYLVLMIPFGFGLSELLSNIEEDYKFENPVYYYAFIGSIISIFILIISAITSFYSISNNVVINPNGVVVGIVLFMSVVTVLTNMGQRTKGLIFTCSLMGLLLFGTFTYIKNPSGYNIGYMILMGLLLGFLYVYDMKAIKDSISDGTQGLLNLDTLVFGLFLLMFARIYVTLNKRK
jgi:hypothetical protein